MVAKRDADFPHALKQAVFAHMDIRPERIDDLLLADDASSVLEQKQQKAEGFRPKLDGCAIGISQFNPALIQFETGKTEHRAPPRRPTDKVSRH